ncbi:unnamed protein product, partial [Musa textilis]
YTNDDVSPLLRGRGERSKEIHPPLCERPGAVHRRQRDCELSRHPGVPLARVASLNIGSGISTHGGPVIALAKYFEHQGAIAYVFSTDPLVDLGKHRLHLLRIHTP